jgi:hypothetical protein
MRTGIICARRIVMLDRIIRESLNDVREFLRNNKLDRDLQLKVLEVMDELERTVRIRNKYKG